MLPAPPPPKPPPANPPAPGVPPLCGNKLGSNATTGGCKPGKFTRVLSCTAIIGSNCIGGGNTAVLGCGPILVSTTSSTGASSVGAGWFGKDLSGVLGMIYGVVILFSGTKLWIGINAQLTSKACGCCVIESSKFISHGYLDDHFKLTLVKNPGISSHQSPIVNLLNLGLIQKF